ncbi:MAG: hypothetical protein ACREBQ_14350, partial [Nitrososphaerales archaeon]
MKSSSAPRFGHKRVAILVMGIILTSAAVALSLSLSAHNFLPGPNARSQGLSSFQSYAQLQDFMATNAKSAQQYNTYG